MRYLCTAALFVLSACTFEDGQGWARIETAELSASVADAVLVTDRGFTVSLTALELDVHEVVLTGEGGGAAPEEEGHHHHGSDTASEPAASELGVIAALPVEAAVDALAGTPRPLTAVEPSRELPRGDVDEVEVVIEGARVGGTVTGGSLGAASVALSADVPFEAVLTAETSRELARDEPHRIDLAVTARLPAGLFDGIDLSSGAVEGHALAQNLLAGDLTVDFGGAE